MPSYTNKDAAGRYSRSCCVAYRPANVFLKQRATDTDISKSVSCLGKRIGDTSLYSVKRGDVVTSDADDIVFDALSGSRYGIVNAKKANMLLTTWQNDRGKFQRALLRAHASVLLSQTVYFILQVSAMWLVVRIVSDLTA